MQDHEGVAEIRRVYHLDKANIDESEARLKKFVAKKERNRNVCLLVYSFLLFLAGIMIFLVLYTNRSRKIDLCDSPSCLRIAASLKTSMDPTVDPCDDFYKFTCGKWYQTHPTGDVNQTTSWGRERTIKNYLNIKDLFARNFTKHESAAVRKSKTFFDSCMNAEARNNVKLVTLFDLLDELSLPWVPAAFSNDTSDLVTQLAKVKRSLWVDVFFGTQVDELLELAGHDVIMFSHYPQRSMFARMQSRKTKQKYVADDPIDLEDETCSTESQEAKDIKERKQQMFEVFKYVLINATGLLNNITDSCAVTNSSLLPSDDEILDTVERVWKLQEQISNLTSKYHNYTTRDVWKNMSHYRLDDLQALTDEYVRSVDDTLEPKCAWKEFIQGLTEGLVDPDYFDSHEGEVYVMNASYFKELALIIAQTDDQILETAVWWTVVQNFVPHSKELREIMPPGGSGADSAITASSMTCVYMTIELMTLPVARLVSDSTLFRTDDARVAVNKMFKNIKIQFREALKKNDWLDEETRLDLLEKVEKMRSNVGFPDWRLKGPEMEAFFQNVELKEDSYFLNKLRLVKLHSDYMLVHLPDTDKKYERFWLDILLMINAFYEPDKNQIVFPMGILQFPWYDLGLQSLNYGAIGSIVGHELSHGFDNGSKVYDKDGDIKIFRNDETLRRYLNRTRCFVDQYSSYKFPNSKQRLSGKQTLNENLADNGGLKLAFEAYQLWKSDPRHKPEPKLPGFTHLTHEQLFFLSLTHMDCWTYYPDNLKRILRDAHSPFDVRTHIALQNSEYFAESWSCPRGSRMNPVKKCQMW